MEEREGDAKQSMCRIRDYKKFIYFVLSIGYWLFEFFSLKRESSFWFTSR